MEHPDRPSRLLLTHWRHLAETRGGRARADGEYARDNRRDSARAGGRCERKVRAASAFGDRHLRRALSSQEAGIWMRSLSRNPIGAGLAKKGFATGLGAVGNALKHLSQGCTPGTGRLQTRSVGLSKCVHAGGAGHRPNLNCVTNSSTTSFGHWAEFSDRPLDDCSMNGPLVRPIPWLGPRVELAGDVDRCPTLVLTPTRKCASLRLRTGVDQT